MLEFSRDDDYSGGVFGSLRQGTVLFSNDIFSKLKPIFIQNFRTMSVGEFRQRIEKD